MGSIKVIRTCKTSTIINENGITLPAEDREFELIFTDHSLNVVSAISPDTNEVIKINEVVFTVSCTGQESSGFYTVLINGMEYSMKDEIFEAARNLIVDGSK